MSLIAYTTISQKCITQNNKLTEDWWNGPLRVCTTVCVLPCCVEWKKLYWLLSALFPWWLEIIPCPSPVCILAMRYCLISLLLVWWCAQITIAFLFTSTSLQAKEAVRLLKLLALIFIWLLLLFRHGSHFTVSFWLPPSKDCYYPLCLAAV